jgi:hypothetical protein
MSSAQAFHAIGFEVGPALDRVQHEFARRAAVAGVDFLAEHHCFRPLEDPKFQQRSSALSLPRESR